MILREVDKGKSKTFAFSTMQHKVQELRKKLGLPSYFTFDACRHVGMTELEEAELTDRQGRALSAHKTQQAYVGYAKRTEKRVLSATRNPRCRITGLVESPANLSPKWDLSSRQMRRL